MFHLVKYNILFIPGLRSVKVFCRQALIRNQSSKISCFLGHKCSLNMIFRLKRSPNQLDSVTCYQHRLSSTFTDGGDASSSTQAEEQEFGEHVREVCAIPGAGQRVMVIQPDIKGGRRKYIMTTRHLKLEETCALVRTLPDWRVIEKKIVRTEFENTDEVFGSGNFSMLCKEIQDKKSLLSAVVIGLDRLKSSQVHTLQKAWGVPVFDRYTIVLQIFKDHAKSEEAKLQVALAEIPYIKSRLDLFHSGFDGGYSKYIGGGTKMAFDRRRFLLQKRESTLKSQLEKLHGKRQMLRDERKKLSIPTVAVVGYTNSGKTTLIKAITEDVSLIPENHLFATLDVTSHEGILGSNMKVMFIDTVGFISDMPITLLDAFRATLEDALCADVVLHIRDASHPDKRLQVVSVHRTLEKMLTDKQVTNMIEVYNKVDLVSDEELTELDKGILPISALTGQGFPELSLRLQEALISAAGLLEKTFRIPNSETMLEWLFDESDVVSVDPDEKDAQYLIVHVRISQRSYGIFRSRFSKKSKQSAKKS